MSAPLLTVRQAWELACPKCGADDRIDVTALIAIRLTPDGSDPDEADDTAQQWDGTHPAKCCACGYSGFVGEFAAE